MGHFWVLPGIAIPVAIAANCNHTKDPGNMSHIGKSLSPLTTWFTRNVNWSCTFLVLLFPFFCKVIYASLWWLGCSWKYYCVWHLWVITSVPQVAFLLTTYLLSACVPFIDLHQACHDCHILEGGMVGLQPHASQLPSPWSSSSYTWEES